MFGISRINGLSKALADAGYTGGTITVSGTYDRAGSFTKAGTSETWHFVDFSTPGSYTMTISGNTGSVLQFGALVVAGGGGGGGATTTTGSAGGGGSGVVLIGKWELV